jgi:hypothetical protein
MGLPPTSTMGLGRETVSSDNLVPSPPARMTAFMLSPLFFLMFLRSWKRYLSTAGSSGHHLLRSLFNAPPIGLHAEQPGMTVCIACSNPLIVF